MKADDVLRFLNGLEPVDLDGLVFAVITGGYTETAGQGRMAGQVVTLPEPSYWPFQRGDVLVLAGEWGREPFGEGRKPAKWDVSVEHFATLEEALACRDRVLGAQP